MRSPSEDRIGNFHEVVDRLSVLFDNLDAWSKRNSGKTPGHPDKPSDKPFDMPSGKPSDS